MDVILHGISILILGKELTKKIHFGIFTNLLVFPMIDYSLLSSKSEELLPAEPSFDFKPSNSVKLPAEN